MAEQEENQESEAAEAAPEKPRRLAAFTAVGGRVAKSLGGLLLKLAVFLFLLVLSFGLFAYPAYRLSLRIIDYAQAHTVEAKLGSIDIRMVEVGQDQVSLFESRKHYDVVFEFKGDKGQKYSSVSEVSWPAPGLKRKLENQYQTGETYTLYLLPDQSVSLDDAVAKDSINRLTGLMGLVFLGLLVLSMLWKRLARRMPALMPKFREATTKSLLLAQLIVLIISGVMVGLVSVNPLPITPWLFAAVYWGLTLFICLALRLLVFEEAAPETAPAPEPEEEKAPAKPR